MMVTNTSGVRDIMASDRPASDLKALYDEAYTRKLAAREEATRIRPLLSRIDIPSDARVLDVGCGNGPLALLLAPLVVEYHGVDFSEAFVASARENASRDGLRNCFFHCAEVGDFVATQPGAFDIVFAFDISEHVPDREWASIVASMFLALKPGGRVCLHTPNLEFFVERLKQRNFVLRQFPEHVAVRTAGQNADFFRQAGFRDVRVEYVPHYNALRHLHVLSRLPLIGPLCSARLLLSAIR